MAKGNLKKSRRNQKIYKMKGCSKKTRKNRSYLGGSADINLAYTGKPVEHSVPNPFLAYTGKGGDNSKAYPNHGEVIKGGLGTPFLNPQGLQRGGNCGCGLSGGNIQNGGCTPCLLAGFMVGGKRHRVGCRCSNCKMMGGENKMKGGNPGIPYPNGLVGAPFNAASLQGLPGVDGVQGGRNYIPPNNYKVDPQTSMISTGAQPPFSIGGKKQARTRKQKGGTMSNFLGQDLINLGRQFSYGLGSAYNALAGYSAPTNPLPWKGQLPNTANLASVRTANL